MSSRNETERESLEIILRKMKEEEKAAHRDAQAAGHREDAEKYRALYWKAKMENEQAKGVKTDADDELDG
jgi:hypothetical protein